MYNLVLIGLLFIPINIYSFNLEFDRKYYISTQVFTPAVAIWILTVVSVSAMFGPKLLTVFFEDLQKKMKEVQKTSVLLQWVFWPFLFISMALIEDEDETFWLRIELKEMQQTETPSSPSIK